ncbi:Acetylcholinesterase [Diplodia seriata]|uniref:Carboxylic ester hydrolase n=1 Tax=Diplodia seriata TaxID=420778 RepID=A0A1S8B607_9PEZI|nr:Acetylcholinesterase [Diplodia seriata]
MASLVTLLLLCFLLIGAVLAQEEDPIVQLDYGTFQGRYNADYNISYFRKIPFGASTAGENRFRAPQPPLPLTNRTTPYNTDQSFDMCPQRTVNGSEDCLYLGLYSRPWTAGAPLRPVLVVFYGGGFIQGSAAFSIPPPMYPVLNASAAANDFVVVYPNYRTNAFGFLPGRAVRDSPAADLNAGLLDQRAALRWVRANIAAFGGDPARVTIQGQSAGGGSVVAQAIAAADDASAGEKLFSRALPGSPFWPKTYAYDAPEAEALYAELAARVGCANQTDHGSLACLKAADVQAIRDASLAISALNKNTTSSFNWAPVVDGDFLRSPLSAVRTLGADVDVVWSSFNTHEGENFVPGGLGQQISDPYGFNNSEAGFDFWLRGYLPRFSATQVAEVKRLYPASGDAEEAVWNSTVVRAGMVFRDSVLACPGLWLAEAAGEKGYLSEYTIRERERLTDPLFLDQQWNQINSVQKSQPVTYKGLAGAMASFFQTGDPNAHKLTDDSQSGVPELGTGKEWVIKTESLEETDIGRLKTRCAFWRENAEDIPL